MKLYNIDLQDFLKVLDKCEGSVYIIDEEGNQFNLKSKLSQIIGVAKLIVDGTVTIDNLICDNLRDQSRIFRYILYKEIPA